MSRFRTSWARRFVEVATIPCGAAVHRVGITRRGGVALVDHRRDEVNALRAVSMLGGQPEGCMRLIAALAGRCSWPEGALAWAVYRADTRREERRPVPCRGHRFRLSIEVFQRLLLKAGRAYESGNMAVVTRICRLLAL